MLKKDYDYTIGQLDEIGEVIRKFQSALTTVKAKKIQNILNDAFISIDEVVREK